MIQLKMQHEGMKSTGSKVRTVQNSETYLLQAIGEAALKEIGEQFAEILQKHHLNEPKRVA